MTTARLLLTLLLLITTNVNAAKPDEQTARRTTEYVKQCVIYQIHPRVFTKEGTLKAAEAHLPRLAELGVDILYLLPVFVSDDDMAEAKRLFTSIGRVAVAAENHLDAVTGLSGRGPAYAYLLIEALADGGVKMGLPKELSLTLAAQTLTGAARMVLETGKHPAELKDMVATPGGTTVQGLYVLEAAAVRSAFIKAVEEATLTSRNMMNR